MRRSDKQITDGKEINEILSTNHICRIALSDGNKPYIVPLNYGYKNNRIYIHSATEGHKLNIIKANNNVCFEVTDSISTVTSEKACDFGTRYRSVIGFGKIKIVTDPDKKIEALKAIMLQQTNKDSWNINESMLLKIVILEIEIESFTGKKSGL